MRTLRQWAESGVVSVHPRPPVRRSPHPELWHRSAEEIAMYRRQAFRVCVLSTGGGFTKSMTRPSWRGGRRSPKFRWRGGRVDSAAPWSVSVPGRGVGEGPNRAAEPAEEPLRAGRRRRPSRPAESESEPTEERPRSRRPEPTPDGRSEPTGGADRGAAGPRSAAAPRSARVRPLRRAAIRPLRPPSWSVRRTRRRGVARDGWRLRPLGRGPAPGARPAFWAK